MRGLRFQVLLLLGLMTWLLLGGAFGFQLIEGWNLLDSFYMALITLTTVGYGEIHPLSDQGKIFNSLLILAGVTTIFASIGILTDMVIKLELADFFGRRRRKKMLQKLSQHYIVCGAGRVGRGVVSELRRNSAPVLLVENSPARCQWAVDQDIPTVQADATRDETLKEAHIASAKGLVSAMGTAQTTSTSCFPRACSIPTCSSRPARAKKKPRRNYGRREQPPSSRPTPSSDTAWRSPCYGRTC